MNSYIIYMATNTINGDEYIGATKRSLEIRKYEHIQSALSCKTNACVRFARAIRKYGASSFEWSILAKGLAHKQAMQAEIAFIAVRKPRYNITKGGMGLLGVRSRPVVCVTTGTVYESGLDAARQNGLDPNTIVQRCRVGGSTRSGLSFRYADSEAVYKSPETEEQKRAKYVLISSKTRGKKRSEESIERYRAASKIRGVPRETIERGIELRKRPVVSIMDNLIFDSVKAAAAHYKLPHGTVNGACANKRKSISPFTGHAFCFREDYENNRVI